jgi:hypothetical protein
MSIRTIERTALRGGGSIEVRVIEERDDRDSARTGDELQDRKQHSIFRLRDGTVLDQLSGVRLQDPRNGENYALIALAE